MPSCAFSPAPCALRVPGIRCAAASAISCPSVRMGGVRVVRMCGHRTGPRRSAQGARGRRCGDMWDATGGPLRKCLHSRSDGASVTTDRHSSRLAVELQVHPGGGVGRLWPPVRVRPERRTAVMLGSQRGSRGALVAPQSGSCRCCWPGFAPAGTGRWRPLERDWPLRRSPEPVQGPSAWRHGCCASGTPAATSRRPLPRSV